MQYRPEFDQGSVPAPFFLNRKGALVWREGGGCLAWFGLPFFLVGFYMFGVAVGLWRLPESADPITKPEAALISLPFLVPGLVMMFGRRWKTVDRSAGVASVQLGLLVPLWRKDRPLSDFSEVTVVFKQGTSDSADTYPVALRAATSGDFEIGAPTREGAARMQAIFLSNYLNLKLTDTVQAKEAGGA